MASAIGVRNTVNENIQARGSLITTVLTYNC